MSTFTTHIYLLDDEHEIPVEVDYDAEYDPGCISGPADNWCPPAGQMTLNSVTPIGNLPPGITDIMVQVKAAEINDKLEEKAWEHYHSRGVDDDPD